MIQSSVQLETIGEQLLRLYRGFSSNFEMGIIPQIIATKGTPFLNRTVRPQNTENSGGGHQQVKTKNYTLSGNICIHKILKCWLLVGHTVTGHSSIKARVLLASLVLLQLCQRHSTVVSIRASRFSCPGFDPWHSPFFSEKNFREKIVDVAEVNQQRCCLEQWTAEA